MRGCTNKSFNTPEPPNGNPRIPSNWCSRKALPSGATNVARPLRLVVIGEGIRAEEQSNVVCCGVDIGVGHESFDQRPTVVLPLFRRRGELVGHDRSQREGCSPRSVASGTMRPDLHRSRMSCAWLHASQHAIPPEVLGAIPPCVVKRHRSRALEGAHEVRVAGLHGTGATDGRTGRRARGRLRDTGRRTRPREHVRGRELRSHEAERSAGRGGARAVRRSRGRIGARHHRGDLPVGAGLRFDGHRRQHAHRFGMGRDAQLAAGHRQRRHRGVGGSRPVPAGPRPVTGARLGCRHGVGQRVRVPADHGHAGRRRLCHQRPQDLRHELRHRRLCDRVPEDP